jgi:hypothetical protein
MDRSKKMESAKAVAANAGDLRTPDTDIPTHS